MEYRLATEKELNMIWDQNIAQNASDKRWPLWKKEYIGYHLSRKSRTFLVLDDGIPVGEGTLLLSPDCNAISGRLALCDGTHTANLNALRIQKAYEGKGLARLCNKDTQMKTEII